MVSSPSEHQRAPLPALALRRATFDAVAAGRLGPATVRVLTDAERSRRLLLLHHVIGALRRTPELYGPLGDPATAIAVLVAAEERDQHAVDEALLYPHTGLWAAQAARLLAGSVSPSGPAWAHYGYLSQVCATIAVRTGIRVELTVPLTDGEVMLPQLGLARLTPPAAEPGDDAFSTATVRCTAPHISVHDGTVEVRVPDVDGPPTTGWTPLPRAVVTSATGLRWQVAIDALDPLPVAARLAPQGARPSVDLATWVGRLAGAWDLLCDDHPDEAEAVRAGLQALVPLAPTPGGRLAGSSGDGFGAAALVLPADPVDLGCLLVHEFRHSALNALLHLVDLCETDPGEVYYAPWRDDPRPVLGLLHGAYAFSAVTDFWRRRCELDQGAPGRRAALEFALARLQTVQVLHVLARSGRLTELGRQLVSSLHEQSVRHLRVPVAPRPARLARLAAAIHRASWRVHHARPAAGWAETAVERYLAGSGPPAPPADELVPDPQARCLNDFLATARSVLGGTATPDDDPYVLLARGDAAAALRRLSADLRAPALGSRSWGALGAALAEARTDDPVARACARVLVRRPELVRAVHELAARDDARTAVLPVAGWLAGRLDEQPGADEQRPA